MPPYNSGQRGMISQFINFTGTKDSVAAKFLKSHGWNVERAVDGYFASPHDSVSPSTISALNHIFQNYNDSDDSINIDGAMRYLADIHVKLDEVVCLAIAELLRSPSMGEFTREGFVDGWKNVNCDTLQKQTGYAATIRARLPNEPDLFRRVYRYTFAISRFGGQRNLSLEIATEQWRLFFTPTNGGIKWNTSTTPWLDLWIDYLEHHWKRPINKDLWEQAEVFMRKTVDDESMAFWNPEGAWPGAIDEFVGFVKAKREKGEIAQVEIMEVE